MSAPVDPCLLNRAAKLWASGATTEEIGRTVGKSKSSIAGLAYRNRDAFPIRKSDREIGNDRVVYRDLVIRKAPRRIAERNSIGRNDGSPIYALVSLSDGIFWAGEEAR